MPVILLLDLDSFYAQCECIRLGLDASKTPLALFQWNSVLAVTYPARRLFGVKRGDSWEVVREKSQKASCMPNNTEDNEDSKEETWKGCLGVHVPILTRNTATKNNEGGASSTDSNRLLLQQDYASIYKLSEAERTEQRKQDIGKRKFSSQGKACIERYRVASAKIFEIVLEWIAAIFDKDVVLERASIDEFYLDVTAAVENEDFWSKIRMKEDSEHNLTVQRAMEETVRVGSSKEGAELVYGEHKTGGHDARQDLLIERGCWIARSIRQAVWTKVGFTLSAGISVNKTIAKLSASYGKPNGQAVTFFQQIRWLLQQTEISKCRNFGGKLGKKVQALLPPDAPTTMDSIRQYLSLPELQKALGDADTARWVHDGARGIDTQPVVSADGDAKGLTASLTAFKSLPTELPLADALSWIELVAQDVVLRVEKDSQTNRRYPRTCHIQYFAHNSNKNKGGIPKSKATGRTLRTHFPAECFSTQEKVADLLNRVACILEDKEGKDCRLQRVGLCAVEFFTKSNAMDQYLVTVQKQPVNSDPKPRNEATRVDNDAALAACSAGAQLLRDALTMTSTGRQEGTRSEQTRVDMKRKPAVDLDLELARKLQASFDCESRLFQASERRKQHARPAKTRRIDSFFNQKKL